MPSNSIRKLYQLFDEATETWHDIYEAPGIEGISIRAEVPREERQPQTLRRCLLRNGAEEAAVADEVLLANVIASDAPVVRRALIAGWRNSNGVFVSHHHVAGGTNDSTVLPPVSPIVGVGSRSQLRGTLAEWQELIRPAGYSTIMTVGLCAVFAAPLLALVQRPSFGLVFFGPSKIGKSFAQLVASSALGFGRAQHLPSLNATPAGLLAAALAFNDHMLPIDEVGTARGPKDKIYVALRDATYALMSGQDTLRHPSWNGAGNGPTGSFRVICLLSSELSPDVWAARNGEARDPGEQVRLIAVPALYEGMESIFDRAPSDLSDEALSDWIEEQFGRLWRGLPEQCGVAFREYIGALIEDFDELEQYAADLVADFEERIAKPHMTPIMRDIISKFGVLYAGGVIAYEASILPLSPKTIFRALRDACSDALGELPDLERDRREGVRLLREKLSGGSILDLDNCTGKERRMIRNADGYHQQYRTGRQYVIRAQVFADLFDTPLRTRRILEWFDDEGLLEHDRPRQQTRSNEWAQRQVTWPDGTRVRSISLYLPAGLGDLDRGI